MVFYNLVLLDFKAFGLANLNGSLLLNYVANNFLIAFISFYSMLFYSLNILKKLIKNKNYNFFFKKIITFWLSSSENQNQIFNLILGEINTYQAKI